MSESSTGVGGVLATATVLPATTALSVFLMEKTHPVVVAGFIGLNLFVLLITAAKLTRYFVNKRN